MRLHTSIAAAALVLAMGLPSFAGDLKGKVIFEGTPPKEKVIQMTGNPQCEKMHQGQTMMTQDFVVGPDKGIRWVFVYLKEGVKGDFPVPSEPVVLDQVGCHYEPPVFGVQVGQKVTIKNSDPLLHNVHIIPKENKESNIGMPVIGEQPHIFDKPEIMVTIKCDLHNWMYSYAGVLPHPFFATTKEDGTFEIKNVPPGDYKLAFWHRRMGEQVIDVKVAGGTVDQNFTFDESMIKGRKKKAGAEEPAPK
jgi:plastocyanin